MMSETRLMQAIHAALEADLWVTQDIGLEVLDRFGDVLTDRQIDVVVAVLEDRAEHELTSIEEGERRGR